MRHTLGFAAALVAAAAIAFGPALPGPFDFDDGPAIVSNATIRPGASALDVLRTPPLGTAASGRPLVNATFAANAALNRALGIAPPDGVSAPDAGVAFRATNVLLHFAAAVLLFAIVDLVLANGLVPVVLRSAHREIAAVVALLWLVHPLQTEAVDYVSQRTEILASLFYLIATFSGVRFLLALDGRIDARPGRWGAFAALAGILGAGCKEIIATLPLFVAALDVALIGTPWTSLFGAPRRRLYLALLVAALLSLAPDLFGARAGTIGARHGITPLAYLLSQGWAVAHYLRLALFPTGLVYDYGQTPILGLSSTIGIGMLGLVAALSVALWRSARRRPLAFLALAFLLLLAPSSSFVPINTEIAAERRMYLALACLITGAVCGAVMLGQRLGAHARVTGRILAVVVVGLLLFASARRSAMYRSPLLLWTSAMERFPSNARAYDNVGAALLREDWRNAPRADSLFVQAIALDSAFLDPWRRRASIAVRAGQYDQAESYLAHMLTLAPSDSDATATLGKVYLISDRPRLAVPLLERLLSTSRDSATVATLETAYLLAARDDHAARRFVEASEWLTRALRLDDRDPEAWTRLAMSRAELGERASAVDAVHRALRVDPSYSPALQVLAALERAR